MAADVDPQAREILEFWRSAGPQRWFAKSAEFDEEVRARYRETHFAAARRALDSWITTPEGALALILLLDQFPRNLWRACAHAWATDPLALSVARRGVSQSFDRQGPQDLRVFWYLPFEHSESLADQDRCVRLMQDWADEGGDAEFLKWAHVHRDVIVQFGRFPHRNGALGRQTTPEEQAFLDAGGFAG